MSAPADHIDYGLVQQLPGMGPVPGDVWRNKNTGNLYTIVRVDQRRRCWVTIRGSFGDWRMPLHKLLENFRPPA